ncbi:hypothetical protein GQ457_03G007380 [Hibiscus cannabinus]
MWQRMWDADVAEWAELIILSEFEGIIDCFIEFKGIIDLNQIILKILKKVTDAKDGTEKSQHEKDKIKINKDVNVPRRASKPLAGVALDPMTSKQPNQPESSLETNSAFNASKSKEPIPASSSMLSSGDALSVNGHIAKSVLPLENVAISGVHSGKLESDENGSDVFRPNIDMPLANLWTDPCIAFAIQILTGIPCDTKKISESKMVTLK